MTAATSSPRLKVTAIIVAMLGTCLAVIAFAMLSKPDKWQALTRHCLLQFRIVLVEVRDRLDTLEIIEEAIRLIGRVDSVAI